MGTSRQRIHIHNLHSHYTCILGMSSQTRWHTQASEWASELSSGWVSAQVLAQAWALASAQVLALASAPHNKLFHHKLNRKFYRRQDCPYRLDKRPYSWSIRPRNMSLHHKSNRRFDRRLD